MNRNIRSLSLLRNEKVYQTKELAIQGLVQAATNDGVAKLARYLSPVVGGNDIVKTIVGFYADASVIEDAGSAQSSYTIIDVEGNASDIREIREGISEINSKIGDGIPGSTLTAAINDINERIGSGFTSEHTVADALDELEQLLTANLTITLNTAEDPTSGYLKTYELKQGGNLVGKIDIPKDLVVESGSLVRGEWDGDIFTENPNGPDTAIKLVIANQENPIYINTKDLVDYYNAGDGISIDNNNNVIGIRLDDNNEGVFLSVSEYGLKLSGVQAAIDAKADAERLHASDGIAILDNKKIKAVAALLSDDGINNPITVDKDGIKFSTRLDCGFFDHSVVVAESASDISSVADPSTTDAVIKSANAAGALTTSRIFNSIAVSDVALSETVNAYADEAVLVEGVELSGGKGSKNGKFNFSAENVEVSNVTVAKGSTIYNVFEGDQTNGNLKYFEAKNIVVDNPSLLHNVFNIYKPADDAVISVKDSVFNLNVNNSNVMRIANYGNATGVTVVFENIDWSYEESPSGVDWSWAGILIYQPAMSDAGLSGDLSKISTWKFIFKDCSYNGVKVTANNFGQHNQVFYLYNVGNNGNVENPLTKLPSANIIFA